MKPKCDAYSRCVKTPQFAILIILILLHSYSYSQVNLEGPQGPPPKLSSITYDHNPNEGWIGRPGGVLYTITNITLANSTSVYWSMLSDSIKLSMDGSIYNEEEILDFDTLSSDIEGGILIWKGSTFIPISGDAPRPLLSKFIVTITDQSDTPLALIAADSLGIPENSGGALFIPGNTHVFKARLEMLVSDNGGTTYFPHLDYYDAAPTPVEAISAYSSYSYGFYWVNDPPELEISVTLNADEGDTALINNTVVKAIDVESPDSAIYFILDWTNNGKILKGDTELAPGDTFTMDDINTGLIAYVNNGAELNTDTVAFRITDGDGRSFVNGEDSVFYLTVNVTPTDDNPTVVKNEILTVNEGASVIISRSVLLTTDPESDSTLVTYTLDPAGNSEFPSHGLLKLNGTPISDGATFTQADISNGMLTYQHDGSESEQDNFVFQVADQYGHLAGDSGNEIFSFEIDITTVNDPPVLTVNEGMLVTEGETLLMSNEMLNTSDIDGSTLIYMLDPEGNSDLPAHGLLKLNGIVLNDGNTFSQEDIINGKLSYQHDGTGNLLDGFVFNVKDADGLPASDNGNSLFFFEINVTPVNDLPVLTKNYPLTVDQGAEVTISNLLLAASDEESNPQDLTFTLDPNGDILLPAGTVMLNGTALTDGQSFTMADLNDSLVTYTFTGNSVTSDFFAFSVTDGNGGVANDAGFTVFHFNITIELQTGLSEETAEEKLFRSFPNPVGDELHIVITDRSVGTSNLILTNSVGEKQWIMQNSGEDLTIPFSQFPAGVYFLTVEKNNRIQTEKVIKR